MKNRLLVVTIIMSFLITTILCTGCSAKKKKIELTTDNIKDYLTFDLESIDDNTKYVLDDVYLGQYMGHYEGEKTFTYYFMKQRDLNFEDVKITVALTVYTADENYNFKFKSGGEEGVHTGSSGKESLQYTKKNIVNIPYEGDKVTTSFELEVDSDTITTMVDLSSRSVHHFWDVEIVDVSGYVITNE